jgi:hypothetical protein
VTPLVTFWLVFHWVVAVGSGIVLGLAAICAIGLVCLFVLSLILGALGA